MELSKPNKNQQFILYTEHTHDSLTQLIIENLKKCNFRKITFIIDKGKFNRLKSDIKNLEIELGSTKIRVITTNYINFLFKRYNIVKPLSYIKYSIDLLLNLVKILLIKQKKNSFFLVQESYDRYLISSLIRFHFFDKKISSKRYIAHDVDYLLDSKNKFNYYFFKNFDQFYVLADFLKVKLMLNTKKDVLTIPFAVPNNKLLTKRENYLKKIESSHAIFTIPGFVDQKRKDYYKIIEYFSRFDKSHYKIYFLGKVIDSNVVKYAKAKKINFVYFNEFVEQKLFDEIILQSHFLLTYQSTNTYEISKTTGILFDSLKYSIPLITNSKKLNHPNVHQVFTNDFNHLSSYINDILSGKYNHIYGSKSLELSQKYIQEHSMRKCFLC